MSGRLAGRTCFVTAAAQGIGRATALAFAAEGARVIATDIEEGPLATLAVADAFGCDVTSDADVAAAAARAGPVDVLFNCAGVVHVGSVLECMPQEWQRAFDINVTSMFRTIRAFLPGMIARRGGSIINMASVIGALRGSPQRAAYGASKGAVLGLTRSVAVDVAAHGIRCNAICPSTVDTPSMRARIAAMPDPDAAREAFSRRQPLGRMGTPEDVAKLALFLASEESAFSTGAAFLVDGGTLA